jgi:hypothetical protein
MRGPLSAGRAEKAESLSSRIDGFAAEEARPMKSLRAYTGLLRTD